ncbi:hypothetical protein JCM10207_006128 [Rhodosporidiobolus poonsookiae]
MRIANWVLTASAAIATVMATSSPLAAQPQAVQLPFVSNGLPSLADVLTRSRQARIMFDYLRDSAQVSTVLVDPSGSSTVLAPVDSAILALARKPHEGPESFDEPDIRSNEEERRRAEYLEQWVKAHLVLEKVDLEADGWDGKEYTTMAGSTVRFATSDADGRKVLPGDVEVVGEEQASNGKVLYLRGTLKVPSA